MKLSWIKALGGLFLAALLTAPAVGATNTAYPGTLNFVEGQASIQNQPISSKSVGSTDLLPGQELTTENGRAEILLTPGVFLRLDHHSAVKMISPDLTSTKVQLEKGRADVEVAEIHKQNNLQVLEDGAAIHLKKKGLYNFSADQDQVRVFKGQAVVKDGDKKIKVKGGHELTLNASKPKARKFNKKAAENDFYNWNALRDQYLSEASANAANIYVGPSWVGPGWYWDPSYFGYTFIPGTGMLYSPFGPWGFYSPAYLYSYAPYLGYYGGYGFYGYPIHHGPDGDHDRDDHVVTTPHAVMPRTFAHVARPMAHVAAPRMSGFHRGFSGPAFHGAPAPAFHGTPGFHAGGFRH